MFLMRPFFPRTKNSSWDISETERLSSDINVDDYAIGHDQNKNQSCQTLILSILIKRPWKVFPKWYRSHTQEMYGCRDIGDKGFTNPRSNVIGFWISFLPKHRRYSRKSPWFGFQLFCLKFEKITNSDKYFWNIFLTIYYDLSYMTFPPGFLKSQL